MVRMIERGEAVPVTPGAGREPIGLAWVRDAGYAHALACDLRKPLAGKVYEAGFEDLSLEGLAEAIGRVLGKQPELSPDELAEPWPKAPDLAAARAELGFQPSALEDCLAEILAWYRTRRLNPAQ
jgi:nucleoside-diphosphate-sugar epimerase